MASGDQGSTDEESTAAAAHAQGLELAVVKLSEAKRAETRPARKREFSMDSKTISGNTLMVDDKHPAAGLAGRDVEATTATATAHGPLLSATGRLTLAERQTRGRSMRTNVPRSAHASWTQTPSRPDPVELLESQAASRLPELVPIRYARMRASAFAFLRGSAIVMAHDLASTPTTGIWTQLCGDCHLSNFGLYASPERTLVFDINDFDETLPGPWEWDVKRLATSCYVAGRHNSFTEADCRTVALTAASSYRRRMAEFAALRELDVWYAHITASDLRPLITAKQTQKKARERVAKTQQHDSLQALAKLTEIVDGRRVIANDPPLVIRITVADEEKNLNELFTQYQQTVRTAQRRVLDRFRIMDFAQKVVGVGSVGTRCFILLLAGRDDDDPLFLQIKEAQPSVLEAHLPKSTFSHEGERVVAGQELMQASSDIFLGWLSSLDGRDFYVRQLRDMKGTVEVDTLLPSELALWADACGWALARAHARAGDPVQIAAYLGMSTTFDRAIADFAEAYANQTERDYHAFLSAIKTGRIIASQAG